MRISELIAGCEGPGGPLTLRVAPRALGLTVVELGELDAAPASVARAIRETIASPERGSARREVPFVRVVARCGDVELAIADDASGGGRMLTETRGGGVPLMLEVDGGGGDRDARIEAFLGRVALATATGDADVLLAALERTPRSSAGAPQPPAGGPGVRERTAYLEAHARATELAHQVRAIDDRMTASVIPDWLWVATGFGGAGVFMTAIALLYPELRVYVLPAMIALSAVGFAAYGLRALRELRTRAELMLERSELRARREEARAEVRLRSRALEALGLDPAEVLLGHGGTREVPADLPVLEGRAELTATAAANLDTEARARSAQHLVFVPTGHARGVDPTLVARLEPMAPPPRDPAPQVDRK